jgi:pimeloyl-ACP methyl ester carboxylesterase
MGATIFGNSREALFGFYHPAKGKTRDVGVLLCGPAPQEYMRTHWAFRKLAELLARAGFHVFRFDYYGTGDSAGDTSSGSLATWRANIATAAQELRDVASVQRVVAVGFRLGALLAASSPVNFSQLVLWEPVVHGERYMMELESVQRALLRQNPAPPWKSGERPAELLGFAFPRALEAEVRALDLTRTPAPKAARVTVMVSEASGPFQQLVRGWSASGLKVALKEVRDDEAAARSGEVQAALLSNTMLNAIVSELA